MDDVVAPDEPSEQETNTKKQRYYTPREVARHNQPEDCWISIHHRVLDITGLIQDHQGALTQPLVRHAGEDLSHWFDRETGDIKTYMDPKKQIEVPFLPHGPFVDVPPSEPTSSWSTHNIVPWWQSPRYTVGKLSKKVKWIEIVNVLTQQTHSLEVCCEETIDEIQDRYLTLNSHAASYTWKYLDAGEFVPLDMKRTLDENGIPDDTECFERFDMDDQKYKPIIHIYYNDDLTIQ